MTEINAQFVNAVNAYTANAVSHHVRMGKNTETEPSPFWARLIQAWAKKGLPTSQNGVATKLKMSQGSTRRWFTGDGYPEIQILRDIAELGGVTIDWLLSETLPRSPIGPNTPLGRLLLVWDQLDDTGKGHVYQAAVGQYALSKSEAVRSLGSTFSEA